MFVMNVRSLQSTTPSPFTSPATPLEIGVAMTMPAVPSENEAPKTMAPELLILPRNPYEKILPAMLSPVATSSSDGLKMPSSSTKGNGGWGPANSPTKATVPASFRAGPVQEGTCVSVFPPIMAPVPQKSRCACVQIPFIVTNSLSEPQKKAILPALLMTG